MDSLKHDFTHLLSMGRSAMAPEIVNYARAKFIGISAELIDRNSCEIITAYHAEFTCQSCCMGIDMCPELLNTAGYTYHMVLQGSGWIKTEYIPCLFNGGKKFSSRPLLMSGGARGGIIDAAGCLAGRTLPLKGARG